MEIAEWWPSIPEATRDWLVAHNGEPLPEDVVEAVVRAGGVRSTGSRWVGEDGPDGLLLSDDAVDWIEAVANGETPDDA
ncbi:hypothetical protein [Auraticoccus monumenti]|uniref:Uncharacterized protein n=1 Tax=Auraticoccus monumenti TaxID=675864 RepID=A0A1G6XUC5_9ACTN|nr:hypothetical protein [Auraticoccus monumenti]SDD81622.1 hypothetical protein SAMN04489747_1808 [Auraticoccus monumenti]